MATTRIFSIASGNITMHPCALDIHLGATLCILGAVSTPLSKLTVRLYMTLSHLMFLRFLLSRVCRLLVLFREFPVSCCLTSDCQDNTCGTIKDPNLFNCQLDDFGVEFCDYNAIDYPSNVNGNHCAEDGFPAYRRNQDGLCTSTGLPDWGRCCESRYGNTNDKDDKDDKQNYDNYYDEDSGEEEVEEEQYAHEDDRNLQQIYRCTDCLDVFDPLDWCIGSYTAFKDAVSFDLSDGDCLVE